jgi:hypothetical protein
VSGRPVTIAGALTELLTRARRVRRYRYSPRLAFAAAGWLTGAAALDNLGVQRFGNLTGGDDTAATNFRAYQPNTRRTGFAEIVNRRGSQRDAYRNRMAAMKSTEAQHPETRALRCIGRSFVIVAAVRKTMEVLSTSEKARPTWRPADFHSPLAGGGQKPAISISPKAWGRGQRRRMRRCT